MGELIYLNATARTQSVLFDQTLHNYCVLELFDEIDPSIPPEEAQELLDMSEVKLLQGLVRRYKIDVPEAQAAHVEYKRSLMVNELNQEMK